LCQRWQFLLDPKPKEHQDATCESIKQGFDNRQAILKLQKAAVLAHVATRRRHNKDLFLVRLQHRQSAVGQLIIIRMCPD
jgi:hypothetical protein